jgi:hypothetical protein
VKQVESRFPDDKHIFVESAQVQRVSSQSQQTDLIMRDHASVRMDGGEIGTRTFNPVI